MEQENEASDREKPESIPHNSWRGLVLAELLMCAVVTGVCIWGGIQCAQGMRLARELGRSDAVFWWLIAFAGLATLATCLVTAWVIAKAIQFDTDPNSSLSARETKVAYWFLRNVLRFDPDRAAASLQQSRKENQSR